MSIKKQTSWVLITALLLTQVLTPDIAHAATLQFSPIYKEKLRVETWTPYERHGSVAERIVQEGATKTLIHIQDAHAIYEAQQNIEALLEEAHQTFKFKNLLLEGGEGKLDPNLRHLLAEGEKLTAKEIQMLVKEGQLTGAELYLMSSKEIQGFGMESSKEYWSNVDSYRKVYQAREESRAFVDSIQTVWDLIATKHLAPEFKKYLKAYQKAQLEKNFTSSWFDGLRVFLNKAQGYEISDHQNQIKFPMMTRYFYLKKIDQNIDFEKLELQKEEFYKSIQLLSKNNSEVKLVIEEVNRLLLNLKNNYIDYQGAREVFEQLVKYLPHGFSLESWPDLKKAIERIILSSEIEINHLLSEARVLHAQAIQHEAKHQQSRVIALLLEKQILIQKLFELQLSREEFKKLSSYPSRPIHLSRDLVSFNSNKIDESKFVDIEKIYDDAIDFYKGAIDRETAMKEVIRGRSELSNHVLVAVAGGFHAEALKEFSKNNQFNYLSIIPRITQLSTEDHGKYQKALLGNEEMLQADIFNTSRSEVAVAVITSKTILNSNKASPRIYGFLEAIGKMNERNRHRDLRYSPIMLRSATRPKGTSDYLMDWEGLPRPSKRPVNRSESRLEDAIEAIDNWKIRQEGKEILARSQADPFQTDLEAQAVHIFKKYKLNALTIRERAKFIQNAFGDIQPAVAEYVDGWLETLPDEWVDSSEPMDFKKFKKISSNMASLEFRYTTLQNQMIRTAGNIVFDLTEQEKRFFELEELLHEFDKEIKEPGTGDIPVVAAMQDLHGGTRRALGLLAVLYGLPEDSYKDIYTFDDLKKLLDEHNKTLPNFSGRLIGFSDLVDRGDDTVGAMELAQEFIENALGRFILGNHDLWRMMGVLGVHQLFNKEKLDDFEDKDKQDHPSWWALEAFLHAGWGDRELEQLNERRINAHIARINKKIKDHNKEHPENKQDLFKEIDLGAIGAELNTALKAAKKKNEVIRGAWQKAIIEEDRLAAEEGREKKPIPEPEFLELVDVFNETYKQMEMVIKANDQRVKMLESEGVEIGHTFASVDILNRENYQQDREVIEHMLWQAKQFRLFYIDIYGNLHMHNIIPMDYEAGGMDVHYKGLDGVAALELMTKDVHEFFENVTANDLIGDEEKVNAFRERMWAEVGEAFTIINSWYSDRVPVAKADAVKKFISEGDIEWYLGSAGSFVDREISGVVFWGHNEAKKFVQANLSRVIVYPEHGSGLVNIDGGMSKGYDNRGTQVTFGLRDKSGKVQGFQVWGYHPKDEEHDPDIVVDLTSSDELTSTMSDDQKLLLKNLADGPTYLKWQRHKILKLLDRGLQEFLRSPQGQKRDKIVQLRRLRENVKERLKDDKDPLQEALSNRSESRWNDRSEATRVFMDVAHALKAGDQAKFNEEKAKLDQLGMQIIFMGNSDQYPDTWRGEKPKVYTREDREEIVRLLGENNLRRELSPAEARRFKTTVESLILDIDPEEISLLGAVRQKEGASPEFRGAHIQLTIASQSRSSDGMMHQAATGFFSGTRYSGDRDLAYQSQYVWWEHEETGAVELEELKGGSYSQIHRRFNPDGTTTIVKTADPREDGGKLLEEAKMMQRSAEEGNTFFPAIYKIIDEENRTEVWMEDLGSISLTDFINRSPGTLHMGREDNSLGVEPFDMVKQIYHSLMGVFYGVGVKVAPANFFKKYVAGIKKRWRKGKKDSKTFAKWMKAPYVRLTKDSELGGPRLMPNFEPMMGIIERLAEVYPEYFSPRVLTRQHGDLHFGNIMVDTFEMISKKKLTGYKLIDPKWMKDGNDPLYDFAKLIHNMFGNYDLALDHSQTFHFNVEAGGKKDQPLTFDLYVDDEASGTLEALARAQRFQVDVWKFIQTDDGSLFPYDRTDQVAWRIRLLFTEASLLAGLFPFHVVGDEYEAKASILYERSLTIYNNMLQLFLSFQDEGIIENRDPKLKAALDQMVIAQNENNEEAFVHSLQAVRKLTSARSEFREIIQAASEFTYFGILGVLFVGVLIAQFYGVKENKLYSLRNAISLTLVTIIAAVFYMRVSDDEDLGKAKAVAESEVKAEPYEMLVALEFPRDQQIVLMPGDTLIAEGLKPYSDTTIYFSNRDTESGENSFAAQGSKSGADKEGKASFKHQAKLPIAIERFYGTSLGRL